MNFLIYALLDQNNIPFYIGKTNNLHRRKRRHLAETRNGNSLYVYNKLRKLLSSGHELQIEVIEADVPADKIDDRERAHISKLRAGKVKLCNLTDGGEGNNNPSPELRKRWSESKKGQKRTTEQRARISESRKGIKFSKEHRQHLSEARRRRKITPETRLKMSESSKGKINIKRFTLRSPDGEVFVTEHGLSDFCRERQLTTANMLAVIKGRRKHHKGWTHASDYSGF